MANVIQPFGGRSKRRWVNRRQRLLLTEEAAAGDEHFSNVVLLLDMEGTDGGQEATDASDSEHTVTWGSAAQLDSEFAKFGNTSLYGLGTVNLYITVPASTDWDFGTGDFTVELHWRPYGVNQDSILIGNYNGATDGWWVRHKKTTNQLEWGYQNAAIVQRDSTIALNLNVWHHLAVCRNGTDLRIFDDGVQVGATATDSTNVQSTLNTWIASLDGTQQHAQGNIDNVRITKGVARYTADFTPPTEPFPTS